MNNFTIDFPFCLFFSLSPMQRVKQSHALLFKMQIETDNEIEQTCSITIHPMGVTHVQIHYNIRGTKTNSSLTNNPSRTSY